MSHDLIPVKKPGDVVTIGGRSYQVRQQVTRTVLSQREMADGTVFAVMIETKAIQRLENYDPADADAMKPPFVCNIVNLDSGEFQVLVMNAVLLSEIQRGYPDDSYVGKKFLIQRNKVIGGKRYRGYKVVEIELNPDAPGGADPVSDVLDGTTKEAADRVDNLRRRGHKVA
jgi:hypothetical protein